MTASRVWFIFLLLIVHDSYPAPEALLQRRLPASGRITNREECPNQPEVTASGSDRLPAELPPSGNAWRRRL